MMNSNLYRRTRLPLGLIISFGVVLACLMTLMAIVLVTQGQIKEDVESVTRQLVSYPTEPWPVVAVEDDVVRIDGKSCFKGVPPWRTDSTETWRFESGRLEMHEGFANFYRAGDLSVIYGGQDGIPVDTDLCNTFEGFGQPIPEALLEDLEAAPCGTELDMFIEFKIEAIEIVSGDSSPPILVRTEPFVLTNESACRVSVLTPQN